MTRPWFITVLLMGAASLAAPAAAARYDCTFTTTCLSDSPCDDGDPVTLKLDTTGPYWIEVNDLAVWGMAGEFGDGSVTFFGWRNDLQPHHLEIDASGAATYSFGQMNREFPEMLFGALYRGSCEVVG